MARQILVEMARSFAVAPLRFDGGDRLPGGDFALMEATLAEADLAWNGGTEAEATLRATYEPLLDGLASYLLIRYRAGLPTRARPITGMVVMTA